MDINLDQLKSTKLELQNLPHNQYWQIPVEGAEYLYQTVLRLKPSLILEIGTSSGYSALWLVEALLASPSTQNSRLITIESNADRFDFASQNFKKAGVESLIQNIKGHAPEVFSQIDLSPSIDLAFFDG